MKGRRDVAEQAPHFSLVPAPSPNKRQAVVEVEECY